MAGRIPRELITNNAINHAFWLLLAALQRAKPFKTKSIITKPKKKGMKARKPKGLKKLSRDILT